MLVNNRKQKTEIEIQTDIWIHFFYFVKDKGKQIYFNIKRMLILMCLKET